MVYIGQVVPYEPVQGILGLPLAAPETYILRTMSQKEKGSAVKLEKHGIRETWYPAEEAWRIQRNAKRDRVKVERLIAPGYLWAEFDRAPVWHRLFDVMKGFVVGVVGIDGQPYAVPDAVMARMKLVPQRIEILRQEESIREKAERLARTPQPGTQARLIEGPLAGKVVDVTRVDYGIAFWIYEGIRGEAKLDTVERVAV